MMQSSMSMRSAVSSIFGIHGPVISISFFDRLWEPVFLCLFADSRRKLVYLYNLDRRFVCYERRKT